MRRYEVCGCFSCVIRGFGVNMEKGDVKRNRFIWRYYFGFRLSYVRVRIIFGFFYCVSWGSRFLFGFLGWVFCLYLYMVERFRNVYFEEENIREEYECILNVWRMLGRGIVRLFGVFSRGRIRISGYCFRG